MGLDKSNIRTLFLVIFMISYVLIGAAIFMYLERSWEVDTRDQLRKVLDDFRADNPCIQGIL